MRKKFSKRGWNNVLDKLEFETWLTIQDKVPKSFKLF